nr:MAG TPA: hypothetical protein [Caudoviricetes sp.]
MCEWMVSTLLGVRCVEWRWCVLLSCSVQWCDVASAPPCPVRGSEWCDHVTLLFFAMVCGVRGKCLSVLLCVVGYPLSAIPCSWWRWGHCGGGACGVMVGGMVLKGGCCCTDLPVCALASPSFGVGVPLCLLGDHC